MAADAKDLLELAKMVFEPRFAALEARISRLEVEGSEDEDEEPEEPAQSEEEKALIAFVTEEYGVPVPTDGKLSLSTIFKLLRGKKAAAAVAKTSGG